MSSSAKVPSQLQTLSIDEAKMLLSLCRAGKLFDIQRWINSGRSTRVPSECKKTPLEVAVDSRFHSLVELLAEGEADIQVKNRALLRAVAERQKDIAELLISCGAQIISIPFLRVLETWEPTLMRFFLNRGANAIDGTPFAEAFGEKIRTSLKAFVEYKQAHPEYTAELQEQADRALRHFSSEGDLKWASLMLWIKANPRTMGPKLYERNDPELYTSAVQETCYGGHLEILKKFKPSAERDDLADLLACASVTQKEDVILFLIGIGARLNDKENGGSSALDRGISHMHVEALIRPHPFEPQKKTLRSRSDVWRSLHFAETLMKEGAQFVPDDQNHLNSILRMLYGFEPEVTVDLLKLLLKYKASSQEVLQAIVTPLRMLKHLEQERRRLALAGLKMPQDKSKKKPPEFPHHLLHRYNRDELYAKAWTTPIQQLAKEYGMSDVGLAKICKQLLIPRPGRGYWAKKAAGHRVPKQPALPPIPIK